MESPSSASASEPASYTITKRTKVPLKPPSAKKADQLNGSDDYDHDGTHSGEKPQSNLSKEELQKRKEELERIVNEEENLRKESLENLRRHLESMDSSMESQGQQLNAAVSPPKAFSLDDSSHHSHWTTDEEGGGGEETRVRTVGRMARRGSIKYGIRSNRNTFTDEELENIPRLVHRNMPFKQSRQEIAIVNKTVNKRLNLQRILSQDWYHVFLKWNTAFSLFLLLSLWTIVIIIFALIYMAVDRNHPGVQCGLGTPDHPIEFGPAFAFSLETCTTVGYGLPNGTNSFFESECGSLQIFIYFQMVFSMMFNAFLFAFLFARLARCEQRGAQVLFSDKAIIEKRDGKWLLHVRVYDYASSLPIVEAHARMYCVSWRDYEKQTRDLVQPHLLHSMRILQPDDELGSTLFTSIPANVTHQIDVFSPLLPKSHVKKSKRMDSGGLKLRQIDQAINGAGIMCPVCGDICGSFIQLKKHIHYSSLGEAQDSYPIRGSHRDPDIVNPYLQAPKEVTENDIFEHLKDKEIMVVVEGIEPMVSGTFQALQSYKIKDIYFGGRFAPCMSQQNGKIFVDIDRFHEILPPGDDSLRNFKRHKVTESY